MLTEESALFPLPRQDTVFTVGIAGSGPFDRGARRRLDAFVQFYTVACQGMRVLIGCETRFERRVLRRLGELKALFPMLSVTLCLTSARLRALQRAFAITPKGELAQLLGCADETMYIATPAIRFYVIATADMAIDAFTPAWRAESRALRRIVGRKIHALRGCALTENLTRMDALAATCGLVPPGRLGGEEGFGALRTEDE